MSLLVLCFCFCAQKYKRPKKEGGVFKKFRDGRDSKKTKEKSFFYQQLQKLLKMELKRSLGQKSFTFIQLQLGSL